jgi:hypothetical protein
MATELNLDDVAAQSPLAMRQLAALRDQQPTLLAWAVGRWRAEVQERPLSNRNRRQLDDAWRQVIRFAGGNPDALIGPAHDVLLAESLGAA